MAVISYIDAIQQAMREEMRRDETVFVLGEDVGVKGGVFGATRGFYEEFGEYRALDTPLAESAIAGVAIGAAMYGMRPIAEMQYADFMLPATNQIINEAAKIRYRSNNDWSCPLVIRAPIGGGIFGGLYHSQCTESVFFGTPGLKIVVPSTPYDAKGLLKAAVRDPDPVLYFEHKKCYRMIAGEVPEGPYTVPIGKAEVKRDGTDLTVITYGLTVHFALQAAEDLAKEGIDALVLDLRTLQPLDRERVLPVAQREALEGEVEAALVVVEREQGHDEDRHEQVDERGHRPHAEGRVADPVPRRPHATASRSCRVPSARA